MRLLLPLALLSILAACGGGGKKSRPTRPVRGSGFTVSVPAGWPVRRTAVSTTASQGKALVSVAVFRLRRTYSPALFGRAAKELDRVAARLASASHGTLVERRTTTIAGRQSRAYRYSTASYDARVAFVLAGRREYELFCQVPDGGGDAACRLLLASFTLR